MILTTEFSCEVVRVTNIEDHPDADRLVKVTFETANGPSDYQVIHGKGQVAIGDLAVYVSVDSLVPVEEERWSFLKSRLDYKKGSDRFRIRAARLRGIYSEGLLVVEPGLKFGEDMATKWNVIKYERPDLYSGPTNAGDPPKAKAKQRITNAMFPVYEILSHRKAPHAIPEGTKVMLTEKIHGCNFRAGWLPIGPFGTYKFVVGSHRAIKTDVRSLWERVKDFFTGGKKKFNHWYGEDVWNQVARDYDLKEKLRPYPGLVFYGEVYGRTASGAGIQDLTYGASAPRLRIFDIWSIDSKKFLDYDMFDYLVGKLYLAQPDVISFGFWGPDMITTMKNMAECDSYIDPSQLMEGIVVKERYGQMRVKYISQRYQLRKGE